MGMKHTITSHSLQQTEDIAHHIGEQLRGGEVIEFVSDVGGGKTTFVKGLAKGAGSKNHVSSPTFKISNVYKTPRFDIAHFDFYRLKEPGLIEHELHDFLSDPKIVIVVEWSNVIEHVLPEERLKIHITTIDDESRKFEFEFPSSLEYVLAQVTK